MGRSLPCPSSLDGLIFSSIVAAGRCADPLHCEMEDQDPLVNVEGPTCLKDVEGDQKRSWREYRQWW